jgi:protein disulfide-isomerase A1
MQEFTAASVAQFVKDAADGKVSKWVKSEPAPQSNDGPVIVLTGNTVHDIVLDESKDVIVEV